MAAAVQAGFLAVSVVLAALSGNDVTSGYRYTLIPLLGVAMGVQNAAVRVLAVPDLTTTVLTMTITGIAADSKLAGGSGSKSGRRLVALTSMLVGGLIGAELVVHGHGVYSLVIALIVLALVAVVVRPRDAAEPTWVHSRS
jgi:uncharacterized membrane protein YoaK (UPF0700 family)